MTEHDHAALNTMANQLLALAAENRQLRAELDASRKAYLLLLEATRASLRTVLKAVQHIGAGSEN